MMGLLHDIRYAFRLLKKSPGFTTIVVATLALGIGANTAIFTVFNAVLLRPLPYKDSQHLAVLWSTDKAHGEQRDQVSATDVADYRRLNHVFEGVSTIQDWYPTVSSKGEPEKVSATAVGEDYFQILRGTPLLGRTILPEEQRDGKDNVVVLSYGYWQSYFGGDPQIVGQKVILNTVPHTIVGVMPKDFLGLPRSLVKDEAQLYRPVAEPYDNAARSSRHLRAIARLRSGVTWDRAQAEMNQIAASLAREYPKESSYIGVRVASLYEDTVGDVRPILRVLLGAVLLILLIAAANVTNLLLTRSTTRRKEIAIRVALGAGNGRLLRQVLTESLLLSLTGGAVGIVLATWSSKLLGAVIGRTLPQVRDLNVDGNVLLFALAISVATGIVFGLAPAGHSVRDGLSETLKSGGRTSDGSASRSPLRKALVVAEMATALVLLVAAGLLVKSFLRLRQISPGFDPHQRVAMNVWLPWAKYSKPETQTPFYRELLQRVSVLPGVQEASVVSTLPFADFDRRAFQLDNKSYAAGEAEEADSYMVGPHYFSTIGIPLLRGRDFSPQDTKDSPYVVIVNDALARRMWPDENPLGKHVLLLSVGRHGDEPVGTVIGVAGDVRQYALDQPATLEMYYTYNQVPRSTMTLVLHSGESPAQLVPLVRREVSTLDSDVAVFKVNALEELISDSVATRRISMVMLAFFAGLALTLGVVGIYGVISHGVAQRTHEIGVRMALGARRLDVLKLIVGQGVVLVSVGVAVGLAASLVLTRIMSSLLFSVSPSDPAIFALVALLLSLVAIAASYLPARRASKVDPMVALRSE